MQSLVVFHMPGSSLKQAAKRVGPTLAADWRGSRRLSFGLVILLVTGVVVLLYLLNNPSPDIYPDTPTYLKVTNRILSRGDLVDSFRTPGYPLLVALVFLVAGQGNLLAVTVVQSLLFLLATLEVYALTLLLFRRSWVALGVGVLLGTNTYILSYVIRPILSEGLALWLVVSLALAVTLFLRTFQLRLFWLVVALTLALFMTRPEWIYLPVPLLLYLLVMARRHGRLRRLLPQSLAAVVLLYGVLGFYIYQNAVQNGYAGVTINQPANLLGKVLQYRMQNEAPPEYAPVTQYVNAFVAQGGTDPNLLVAQHPELAANHWALAGAYSAAIIEHHPIEFGLNVAQTFFSSCFYTWTYAQIAPQGTFAPLLTTLHPIAADVYRVQLFVPLFLLIWGILLFWRRTSHHPGVERMGVIILLVFYELALIATGGWVDYMRLHVPIGPLFILLIWGSLLASLPYWKPAIARLRLPRWGVWLLWGGIGVAGVVLSLAVAVISGTWASLSNPGEWEIIGVVVRLAVLHPLRLALGAALLGVILFLVSRARQSRRVLATARGPGSAATPEHAGFDPDDRFMRNGSQVHQVRQEVTPDPSGAHQGTSVQ